MPELLKLPPITESALHSDQIHAIGIVAAEWGYAESTLELLIWALAEIDINRGRSVTTHLSSVTRQDIAKTLANETLIDPRELSIKDSVLQVLDDFDELRIKRNKIIHAVWMVQDTPPFQAPKESAESLVVKARGKLEVNKQPFDPTEIRNTALEITNLIYRMSRIVANLPKLPDAKAVKLARQSHEMSPDHDPKKK